MNEAEYEVWRTGKERRVTAAPVYVPAVPALCPGGTVVCIASGPSLTPEDAAYCQGKAVVIAVNDAVRFAPFADALMASDADWWACYDGVPTFRGLKYSLEKRAAKWGVTVLKNTGQRGLERQPTGLRTGLNSGAAAINLAVHFGAKTILLLGYDMGCAKTGPEHFFGAHPKRLRNHSPYHAFRQILAFMAEPLRQLGVTVINCSRHTWLTVFPRQPLREALP